jgi:anti-sigma B factor antagonist
MPLQPACPYLRIEELEDITVVRLATGDLAENRVREVGGDLSALADRLAHGRLTLDLSEVGYLTSTALGTLVALNKHLRLRGGHLALVNVADIVFEVFAVTRLDRILDIRRGLDDRPSEVA